MKKQIVTAPHKIHFEEVSRPKIEDDEVLIRIMRIGICGSDIHVYHGEHPFTDYPITQGHEVSGYIEAVGNSVNNLKVGQKVTIEPQVVCGKCHPCRNGKYNLCEKLMVMGFQTNGAACEYFAVNAANVTPLPDKMSYDEGAMIEPLAVAVHSIRQTGNIEGFKIAVIGAGPIGNLVAQTALGMGAKDVMITDVVDYRLNIASQCGIKHCINTGNASFEKELIKAFGPDKADVIYDCAGNDTTMGQAISSARKGSVIVLVAVFAKLATVDLAVLNDHELNLKTSMMYRHEDYIDAIKLVSENKVELAPLISGHYKFDDYLKAYQYIDKNRDKTMKIIIDVG